MCRSAVLPVLLLLFSVVPVMAQDSGKRMITAILVSGQRRTRESVIRREIGLQPGDSILVADTAKIREQSRLRLVNLPVFTTVRTSWESDSAGTGLVLNVVVKERFPVIPAPVFQLADRNFNVWWYEMNRDLKRINLGITLTDNNFRGNLEQLAATVQAGYVQRLGLSYTRPYLDAKQRHGIGISAAVAQSGEIYYKTDSNKLKFARLPGNHIFRQYDFALSWYYRPAYAIRHSLSLGYHHADVSDTVLSLNPEYFGPMNPRIRYADLIYRIDYNGVDNWNYPLKGLKSVTYALVRKGFDEGFDWQAQIRTESGWYSELKPKTWYGAVIFRGRLSTPGKQPYYFRSALGTRTDYVRGYEYYVIDGSHYGLLRLNLKYAIPALVFRNLPLRYLPELPLRFYPKLFADAGYVQDPQPGNGFLHNRLLYSAGLGFDFVTYYDFKLRLEFAVNHLGQYGLYLHLNSE
jgi:outer membrane protein assembly factor BamA